MNMHLTTLFQPQCINQGFSIIVFSNFHWNAYLVSCNAILTLQQSAKRLRVFSSAVSKDTIWSTKTMGTHWQIGKTDPILWSALFLLMVWHHQALEHAYIDNKVLIPCVFMGPAPARIKKSSSASMLLDSRTSIHNTWLVFWYILILKQHTWLLTSFARDNMPCAQIVYA